MKVAVPSAFPTVDACVAAELCCSQYLLIITLGTMEYEAMPNPVMALGGPAAGRLFAQQLLQENVSKVLANNCDSNILKFLGSAGIQIIGGISGSVRRAVKQLKEMGMAETVIIPFESLQD